MIKKLTKQLLSTLQRTGWGYPSNYINTNPIYADTSNTQYALLGLRAAVAMGESVPKSKWRQIAQAVIRRQGRSGGFGYQNSEKPTGAMTVAGLTSLVICAEALPTRDGLAGKIRAARKKAMDWLEKNWSVERNVAFPKSTKETDRWIFYHLYGLERLGAYLDADRICGHDWYAEGLPVVLKAQTTDGSWLKIMREADTCFALLFLRRGSRTTGLAPRVRVQRAAELKHPVTIGTDGRHPAKVWVRKGGAEFRRIVGKGMTPTRLIWTVDEKQVEAAPITEERPLESHVLQWAATGNGAYTIKATVVFGNADAQPGTRVSSNPLLIKVDNISDPEAEAVVADLGNNLLKSAAATVTASSHSRWTRPEHAVDGTLARGWLCAPDDKAPWIRVELEDPVRARSCKLVFAKRPAKPTKEVSRPRLIEISFDGGRKRRLELLDSSSKKHELSFSARTIRRIDIRILDRYPGKIASLGFAAIELQR